MLANSLLKIENLTKVYEVGLFRKKYITAVDKVSFNVSRGEIISLVGESGSGKTTVAKIILRLLPPTSGKVFYKGEDIWEKKDIDKLKEYWREVHAVFQDPFASFNPVYKIDRVLEQAFNLMDTPVDENAIREALKEVALLPDEVLGKYPHELSGGQRQRLMIARCFLLKPKLILADEPVSMVDASTRASIVNLFLRLRDEYKTSIIFITHDLGLAYFVSDRILIMYKGRIVEEGSPDELISSPKDAYTKNLLESVPLLYGKWKGF
ncbi:MAG: ATP-binding cassette domain-containing protein [Crenarchaeota archaeon]|nr:ATP-binding cassette domain-containing protein [Thermoproteota archaeon]MDW8034712.1 ABC transporter ATP-binding protein [Nitrososphaerota archaeon]